jgi:hypothetical protein
MEETMTDPIAQARAARVRADMQPIADALSKVRNALDDYERSALERAEQRVLFSILAAIGQHDPKAVSPAAENETVEAETVLKAFEELRSLLALPADPETAQPVAGAEVVTASGDNPLVSAFTKLPAQPAPPPPHRTLTRADQDRAEALLAETAGLIVDWRNQPTLRLSFLLRAIAAETRALFRTIPHEHALYSKLERNLPKLLSMRNEAGIEDYIKGLSVSAKDDWTRLTREYRGALARFDRDAEAAVSTPRPPPTARKPGSAKLGDVLGPKLQLVAPVEQDTRWPLLRAGLVEKPLLLVGGTTMEDRVRGIKERTGITLDWKQIARSAPRQVASIAETIAKRGPLGCLIVDGFMSHKDWWPIQNACKQSGMPYAMADKAGTASIERAFDALERALSNQQPGTTQGNQT